MTTSSDSLPMADLSSLTDDELDWLSELEAVLDHNPPALEEIRVVLELMRDEGVDHRKVYAVAVQEHPPWFPTLPPLSEVEPAPVPLKA